MYSITLEVNQICNFSCDYCYLGKLSSKRMDFVTAYQAMEIAFLNAQRHPDHEQCRTGKEIPRVCARMGRIL